jgi:hypothetical protein
MYRARTSDQHQGLILYLDDVNMVQSPTFNIYEQMINNSGFDSTFPFGKWVELLVHIHKDATDGRYGLYFNGMLVSEMSGIDTTELEDTDLSNDWTFTFEAFTGITWDIAGPIDSWSGTDITVRPNWDTMPTSSFTKEMWPIEPWEDSDFLQGRSWTVSGSATRSVSPYGSPSNGRERYVVSGSDGDDFYLSSIDSVGTLPYATTGGWATILFKQVYTNGNATVEYAVRNSTNTADVVRLTINTSNQLMLGATVLTTLSTSKRYNMCIHFNSDGSLRWSVFDVTTQPAETPAVQKIFGGSLGTWTPQALGIITQGCVLSSASAAVEFDGM